jgi:hypothetical protein
LALINANQFYDILNHYFKLHEKIEEKIASKQLIIDGVECDFNFIICSDMKSLLMFVENTVVFAVDHIKTVIVKLKVFS